MNAIKKHGKKSLAKLAELTDQTKSSIYRQTKKIDARSEINSADFFETSTGAEWLRHLVFAVTLVFGLQANVGEDRLGLFFKLIDVTQFVGVSASSMGRLKKKMMQQLQAYELELQPVLNRLAKNISIVTGADETFFDRLIILLFMDLSSGFIFLEEGASDRKAETWNSKTTLFRNKFKDVLCLASDRGKSLITFTTQAKIKSIAELFHIQQSIVTLFRFAFASKTRSLNKQKDVQKKELNKLLTSQPDSPLIVEYQESLKEIEIKNTVINNGQATYKEQLNVITTAVHPFENVSQLKTSAQLTTQLQSNLATLRVVKKDCEITDGYNKLNYFENNIDEMSSLIDLWWRWIDCDIENVTQDIELRLWLKTKLLPTLYWKQQIKKSRASKPLKKYYKKLFETAEHNLNSDPLTQKYLTPNWMAWAKEWVLKFQRSTSQVEGRNARLSENHHCLRGLSELHIKAQTILHNFWITRDDNTTACERLFKEKPPNLFEWLCKKMPELPEPRKRWTKTKIASPPLEPIAAI